MSPTDLIEICHGENQRCGREAGALGKTSLYYLGSILANEVQRVKRDVGVARIAIGAGHDRLASEESWCNEGENSTLVFARVTIIFTRLSTGHAVAGCGEFSKRLTKNADTGD